MDQKSRQEHFEAVPLLDKGHRKSSQGIFVPRTWAEVHANCKVEYYPGHTSITVADKPVFKCPGWESSESDPEKRKNPSKDAGPEARSISRARKKVRDIALLNDFQYFVTWTLDRRLIERENPQIVSRKLRVFLSNKVQRNDLKYVVVPELHKDKRGIHVHGLTSGNFKLVDSMRRTKRGQIVYNMPEWTYGYSTCVELSGDRERTALYISKYISKDFGRLFGNFYYAGGNISRTPPTAYCNVDYDAFDVEPYFVPELGVSFKYVEAERREAP